MRVVDSHCHAFLPQKETQSFETYVTLTGLPMEKEHLVNSLLYRIIVSELKKTLKIDGFSSQVVDERNRRYRQNPEQYIQTLFRDAGIDTLLVDTGYPSEFFSGYSVPLEVFSDMVQCKVNEIYRIENLVIKLLTRHSNLDQAVEEFNHTIDAKIKDDIVALKSVIAYRTGLSVVKIPEEEVKKAYNSVITSLQSGSEILKEVRKKTLDIKTVFDHFLFEAIGICHERDIPLQIHVGMGDIPGIDLRTSNPILLQELVSDPEALEVKIILTHGGYPYLREAGFLAATYPNVFIDFSETVPFSSIGAGNMLRSLFEMTPVTKIMYGSDCFNIPELAWISALLAKKELESTLNNIQKKWNLDDEWTNSVALKILSENAKRVYKLP